MQQAEKIEGRRILFPTARQVTVERQAVGPPGADEILLRTISSTISTGTELTLFSGEFPTGSAWARYARYPVSPGYSNCGEVIGVGDGVSDYSIGDRLVSYSPHADYVTITPDRVMARVPDEVDSDVASTFALGLIAINGVRRARLELGEGVVVYGLGILGLLVVQLSRLCGCRPVIGVDLYEQRRRWAGQLGADLCIDGTEDVPAAVREATGGRMADVLFEVTGNPQIIEQEFRVLRRFGRAVILSSPRGPSTFDFHDFCNSPSITIIGAHNGSTPACETVFSQWTWRRNCQLYLDLIQRADLRVAEMITHRFSPDEAPEVYNRLLEDRGWAGFIIFDWSRGRR